MTPAVFIAYAPRGAGLLCATTWLTRGENFYGWYAGAQDGGHASAFFGLENYFGEGSPALYATDNGDPYGGWLYNWASSTPELADPLPVADDLCHQLEMLQDAFIAEWLWFDNDPEAGPERPWYREAEIAVGSVNLKHRRISQLDKRDPIWTYASHGLDRGVLEYIARRWPLEWRPE